MKSVEALNQPRSCCPVDTKGFTHLPPEQHRKSLQQKIDDINKELQKEMDQRKKIHLLPKRDFLGNMDAEIFHIMLYDCRRDSFIPGVTLWDEKSLKEDLRTYLLPQTDLKFSSSDSLSSKSSLLDISASLKVSLLGGMVEVGGSAKYLRDTKSSNQQARVTVYYSETSRFDKLTMTQLGHITYPQVFDHKTATHVVTAVLYEAQALMVFDQTFSEDENQKKIEGELSVMVQDIPVFGEGRVEITDSQKEMSKNITCTFHGDICLKQNPTTYLDALDLYKNLPTLLKGNAVPIKVWLYPLCALDTKAAELEREISINLVSNTEDIMEGLEEAERTFNDLCRNRLVNVFSDIKNRLDSFQESFKIYKTVLQKAVAMVLPAIRGDRMEEKSLDEILKIHYDRNVKSPLSCILTAVQVCFKSGYVIKVGNTTEPEESELLFDDNDKIIAATLWPSKDKNGLSGLEFTVAKSNGTTTTPLSIKSDDMGEPVNVDVKSGKCCGITARIGDHLNALSFYFI